MPQTKQVNMGGYTSLHLQSGNQANKHNKNPSEHYPVQINGR
ncbi:MAG: hypothetical protein ACK521_11445 [bacterium]